MFCTQCSNVFQNWHLCVPYNWGNQMYLQKLRLCQKRSVVFMCAGWISPPQRNPVCGLELQQLCFLMLCGLLCPVLLPLALRLIFNPCSVCASDVGPVCQMALRLQQCCETWHKGKSSQYNSCSLQPPLSSLIP